ncbi:glutathione S-transferase family protein [Falsiroseomonas tokyonensis]|uniref:Glutathione S-transferase family protein n=1 Tax=Falsiroseomonas tokyonensis TaxID=430521 RepID=A0ABV7C2G5_9PROT|nr:glutathione S-transferase family protein [Falsiroseomonas tokyonensis]MBU8540301.1 glutathione S-transferase family protein [Falsiroseomonas tokyonensis]
MTYILYGDAGSGSAPVEMALAEAGAAVELREVPLEGDHQLRDDYRAINPMGRLPTLILPDGTVMTESLAILVTLADIHPGLLPPPGDSGRARALRWMALLAGEFYPQITRWDYPARFGVSPDQHQALKDRAQDMARDVMRVIEAHAGLTGDPASPYLLGTRFSVADLYIAVLSRWAGGRVWTPANLPRIEALAQAVARRPAIAPLWAKHHMASAA